MNKKILISLFLILSLLTAGCISEENTNPQNGSNENNSVNKYTSEQGCVGAGYYWYNKSCHPEQSGKKSSLSSKEPVSITKAIIPLSEDSNRGNYTAIGKAQLINAFDVPKEQLDTAEQRKEHVLDKFKSIRYSLPYSSSLVEVSESKLKICKWNYTESGWKKINSKVKPEADKVEFQFSESENIYAVCHLEPEKHAPKTEFDISITKQEMSPFPLRIPGSEIHEVGHVEVSITNKADISLKIRLVRDSTTLKPGETWDHSLHVFPSFYLPKEFEFSWWIPRSKSETKQEGKIVME